MSPYLYERREAEMHLYDQVADGKWDCFAGCGRKAKYVTNEGLLCTACHIELIGPVDPWDDNPDQEES